MSGFGYEELKAIAQEKGVSVKNLLALAPKNDPFYMGTPGDWEKANWFREIWAGEGSPDPIYIRRLHYRVQGRKNVLRPDGQVYVNSKACWSYMKEAAKVARYLRTIPPDILIDKRSPDWKLHADYCEDIPFDPEESFSVEPDVWGVEVEPSMSSRTTGEFITLKARDAQFELFLNAFYNGQNRQPYHLEVWEEKSEIEDLAARPCRRYSANYVPNIGEVSITRVRNLVERIETEAEGKPARIWWLSDFDAKGYDMPKSFARKIEYYARRRGLDIRMRHLAVTPSQAVDHDLPRTPMPTAVPTTKAATGAKAYETLKAKFEAVYGEGAVELNAMEALIPGEITKLLKKELSHYYDSTVGSKIESEIARMRDDVREVIQDELLENKEEIVDIRNKLREPLSILSKAWKKAKEEHDIDGLMKQFKELLEIEPDLSSIEFEEFSGELVDENDEDWLLDTKRTYGEQLKKFKEFDMRWA